MSFLAYFAGALVLAFLAMSAAEQGYRRRGALIGFVALLLVGLSVTSALPQTIPPPTAEDRAAFKAHAIHPNCKYAQMNQDAAASRGTLDDWRWAAVGWKVCRLELAASGAPPEALHVADYQLVQACEQLFARKPDAVLRACE
jgi:hypothetical protein